MVKAPLAQQSLGNPGNAKKAADESASVDNRGVSLSIAVAGADTHDVKEIGAVPVAGMVERALPGCWRRSHPCADTGRRGQAALATKDSHRRQRGQRRESRGSGGRPLWHRVIGSQVEHDAYDRSRARNRRRRLGMAQDYSAHPGGGEPNLCSAMLPVFPALLPALIE